MAITNTDSLFKTLQEEALVKIGRALDLGCGKGFDANNFADAGFMVDAVDSKEEAIQHVRGRNRGDKINPILANIETFDIKENYYTLVSSQYTLQFLSEEISKDVIKRMVAGCVSQGLVIFTLIGDRDEWKDKWSVWTKEKADKFIAELPVKIHKTIVEEGLGQTRVGKMKWWNVFTFVLVKM